MEKEERLKAFEGMLLAVQNDLDATMKRMEQLRAQGKEKTVTYRQLIANKLQAQNILALYRLHGLLDKETK